MDGLTLYKFLEENRVEHNWASDELIAWLHPGDLAEFSKQIESYLDGDEPNTCYLTRDGYVGIDLVPICEYYEIDPNQIHERATSKVA